MDNFYLSIKNFVKVGFGEVIDFLWITGCGYVYKMWIKERCIMGTVLAGITGFLIGFVLGMLVLAYLHKKKTGGLASGYDKQAFNGDANMALTYLKEGDYEGVESLLRRVIKRTGMGFRDEHKKD